MSFTMFAALAGNSSSFFRFHTILAWLNSAPDSFAFSARPVQSRKSVIRTTWVSVEVPILSRLTAR
ncbi:hypothetical protein GCM10022247_04210 [Allokutzneria multivorans]|uniref:Secreted protein n=1 Tax=Allokutzneria multivorans TaxID=1142134 RepID=A0ABP7QVV7_9PSEU